MTVFVPPAGASGASALAPGSLSYLRTRFALETFTGSAILAATITLLPDPALRAVAWSTLAALVVIALLIELPWLSRRHVECSSYTVTPDFVYIARGSLIRRSRTISTAQILNVETVQGPLTRRFGMLFVRFTCVAGIESLGPLDTDAADAVRAVVLKTQCGAV